MRTTLTLDDDISAELKEMAFKIGRSFKQVVNSVPRMGIEGKNRPRPKPYRPSPLPMALGAT